MEEASANFRTNIDATINEGKSFEPDTNRDSEEIRRERQSKYIEMEERLDSLLG